MAGVALLAAVRVVERRAAEPILPFRLFRLQVFNVASGVGFVIGFAMFGAITFLPVFLQLVGRRERDDLRASTSCRSWRGLLIASITSGQIIRRSGRYKIFPVVGTALAAIGVFLLPPDRDVDVGALADACTWWCSAWASAVSCRCW